MTTNTKTNTETKTDEKQTYIIKGRLKSAFVHLEKNDDGSVKGQTNVITLKSDVFNDTNLITLLDCLYEHTADKWIPQWYKDKSKLTLKSSYNVPVKIVMDRTEDGVKGVIDFDKFVRRGFIEDAEVEIKCNVKESALYPAALKVFKDGKEYDPFADF